MVFADRFVVAPLSVRDAGAAEMIKEPLSESALPRHKRRFVSAVGTGEPPEPLDEPSSDAAAATVRAGRDMTENGQGSTGARGTRLRGDTPGDAARVANESGAKEEQRHVWP